jgi:hypothetical protein
MFAEDRSRECEVCGRRYVWDWRRGHTRRICNSCRSNGWRNRYEFKAEVVSLKGGGCEICGYSRCPSALTFHHLDPATKSFTIAGGHTRSRESLLAEIKKCVLLCSNCHREVEVGMAVIPPAVRRRVEAQLVGVPRREVRRIGRPAFNDPA